MMSSEDATMCICLVDGDYDEAQHLARCNLGPHPQTHIHHDDHDHDDDDDTSSSSSSSTDDDDDDDDDDEQENCWPKRQVAEGDVILTKSVISYLIALKQEYRPKDAVEQPAFCLKILERVVVRFASEAFQHFCGWDIGFRALLTDNEYEKLCGMEEVANVMPLMPIRLD
ncbi:hypothetical protein vseg_018072 [Gypsophila vaccaria]